MRGLGWILAVASVFAAGAALECGSSEQPCDADAGACADANVVPPVSGGGCDSSKPPSQGGCAVDDSDGFFVAPTGSDSGTGAKATPFQTIARGISAAAGAPLKPNVYVCQGTYAESLVIESAPAGVALHGGFDCASWTQVSAPTNVAPAWVPGGLPEYVLHVRGSAALVESMTLTAPDATDPGASSIAAFVDSSPGMTFRRAAVIAGKGADAVTGTTPPALGANASGNPASSSTQGGAAKSCPCATDTTTGGQGGSGGTGADVDAGEGLPTIAGHDDAGLPGQITNCLGGSGANAADGTVGASTSSLGTLAATGWTPGAGAAGVTGGTAQGGGGGFYAIGGGANAGGSGGCGGCGGAGGAGGAGGGASIAVAVIDSTFRIQASTIRAGVAGNGANGASGQTGEPGGAGGAGSLGCTGGTGGTGGAGGPGGGGAGGVSVAVATVGTTPDVDTVSTVLAGSAGTGGFDGMGAKKAIDGVADAEHAF